MKTTRARIGQEGPIIQIEVAGPVDRERDVSALDRVLPFDGIVDSVAAVASAMTEALRRASPEEAEVQFGVDVGVESGNLTSLLVKGTGMATLSVRLLWKAPT
jgi:hypothetical protein